MEYEKNTSQCNSRMKKFNGISKDDWFSGNLYIQDLDNPREIELRRSQSVPNLVYRKQGGTLVYKKRKYERI